MKSAANPCHLVEGSHSQSVDPSFVAARDGYTLFYVIVVVVCHSTKLRR